MHYKPKFTHSDPYLWFAKMDDHFVYTNVVIANTKFDLVTLHLEKDVVLDVEDLATHLNLDNKFTAIKTSLDSEVRRVTRITAATTTSLK